MTPPPLWGGGVLVQVAVGIIALPAQPPVDLQLLGQARRLNLYAARALRQVLHFRAGNQVQMHTQLFLF